MLFLCKSSTQSILITELGMWCVLDRAKNSLVQVILVRRQVGIMDSRVFCVLVSNFAFSLGTFFVAEMKEMRNISLVNKLDLIDCFRLLHSATAKHTLFKELREHLQCKTRDGRRDFVLSQTISCYLYQQVHGLAHPYNRILLSKKAWTLDRL